MRLSRNVPTNVCKEKEKEKITTKNYSEKNKQQILYEYHDAPIGGHQEIERTLNRIRSYITRDNKGCGKVCRKIRTMSEE